MKREDNTFRLRYGGNRFASFLYMDRLGLENRCVRARAHAKMIVSDTNGLVVGSRVLCAAARRKITDVAPSADQSNVTWNYDQRLRDSDRQPLPRSTICPPSARRIWPCFPRPPRGPPRRRRPDRQRAGDRTDDVQGTLGRNSPGCWSKVDRSVFRTSSTR